MRLIDADELIERVKAAPIREKNKVIGLIHTERTAPTIEAKSMFMDALIEVFGGHSIVHLCHYDGVRLEGDIPNDGDWALFVTNEGECEVCRFKQDAYDHFFPPAPIRIENVEAWISLDDIRRGVRAEQEREDATN